METNQQAYRADKSAYYALVILTIVYSFNFIDRQLLAILQGWEPSSVELPWLTKIETDDGGMAVNAYLIKSKRKP